MICVAKLLKPVKSIKHSDIKSIVFFIGRGFIRIILESYIIKGRKTKCIIDLKTDGDSYTIAKARGIRLSSLKIAWKSFLLFYFP